MSIYTDQAVKELQEKVAWLERELAEVKKHQQNAGSPQSQRLSLGKGKPS